MLADIARLKARRLAEMARIAKALRTHHDLARRLKLVLSIPGIGERTALALIVRMPELGRISREEAAALAGLAPFDDDSGTYEGRRHIAGGRGRLRRSLFAAALPAAFRWNQALGQLYGRLIAAGKPHNLALVSNAMSGVPVWSHAGIICTGETYKDKVKFNDTEVDGASATSEASETARATPRSQT